MTHSFTDDYSEGCHPEILAAFANGNLEQQAAYGNDAHTRQARERIAAACGTPGLPVFLVSGGTLANLIICAAALRPHEAVIAATSGHISLRETGAIEATGHKVITVASDDGKVTPAAVRAAVAANGQAPHMAKPRMVYVSNATEFGTVYSLAEMHELRSVCDELDLLLMVDGARLGVALASPLAHGLTLDALNQLADVFWIGGTKAGTLFGEAIVVSNPELAHDFEFHLKQRGALLAKGRTLGVQFAALFDDTRADGPLFAEVSRHANRAAARLADGLVTAGHRLAATTESNQVFAVLPNALIERLLERHAFYVWEDQGDGSSVVRLVTSWATEDAHIDGFLDAVAAGTA